MLGYRPFANKFDLICTGKNSTDNAHCFSTADRTLRSGSPEPHFSQYPYIGSGHLFNSSA